MVAKVTLKNLVKCEVEQVSIPNGSYKGEWSGYIVTFNTPYGKYKMDCSAGLRGTAPCTVVVKDGEYTVTRTV